MAFPWFKSFFYATILRAGATSQLVCLPKRGPKHSKHKGRFTPAFKKLRSMWIKEKLGNSLTLIGFGFVGLFARQPWIFFIACWRPNEHHPKFHSNKFKTPAWNKAFCSPAARPPEHKKSNQLGRNENRNVSLQFSQQEPREISFVEEKDPWSLIEPLKRKSPTHAALIFFTGTSCWQPHARLATAVACIHGIETSKQESCA